MPKVQRSTDVIEIHSERALSFGLVGLVLLAFGGLLIYYQGMFVVLGYLLAAGGLGAVGYSIYCGLQIRKVHSTHVACPYCEAVNPLTEKPEEDFSCVGCHRMIHVVNGRILPVFQVRCGFCNHLNYYSETSVGLICEECDREIPIAASEGNQKAFFRAYTQQEDVQLYELTLVSYGHKTEELISCLQHMLALNRNQVKDLLAELPQTLLTGIPRKKAEILASQLSLHEAAAEFHPVARV